MATFDDLVNQIDNNLDNQRDRGTAFEKMVVAYLKNEPTYKQKFSDVWMLSEVPAEYHISKRDTGVDIVAKDYAGNLTAVQAKYYKGKVGKDTINSFVAEAGKDYYAAGMLVSSTDEWNRNAEAALENNTKPFTRIGLSQLRHADIDWKKFSFAKENDLSQKVQKKLRGYQKTAINNSVTYFKNHDRGKLIMAPGTGKTFTSLKIAEALMNDQKKHQFYVLYLVPSIQLLTQTLFNWNNDVSDDVHMTSFSVVSDTKANKKKGKDDDTLGAKDVGFEPTTNVEELVSNFKYAKKIDTGNEMTVVFSTYQSIDVIHKAQEQGIPEFDLIIADEAHRTTGATKLGEDSAFTEVHSNKNVKGELRLYQTATPKIYDANAKRKAEENSIVVSSMDDEERYGEEIFRLGFGDAVAQGYLTDYKVTVLAVSESYINKDMQRVMAADNQLKVDDIGKIIGVWNAMVKRNGITGEITGAPMKRAIAFTDTIKHSKAISEEFETVVNEYLDAQSTDSFQVDVHHVDGGLNALQKEEQIDWLADDGVEDNHARVLSNVRFLTEGIDVPNLDAIIFFSPKKSQVDIVQAVGRIMRRAEGKEYGYIILPIVVADGVDPRDALDNDKQYKQVWQVLNALRSTDERFDAEVNKLDLNKKKDGRINFIGVDSSPDENVTEADGIEAEQKQDGQMTLPLGFEKMRDAFYGKVVQKVGDRRYLEDWSKDVSNIAHMYIRRIGDLIESNQGAKLAFDKFLNSLHHNINDSITQEDAIEMLAQHLITEPIFDALFGEYSFVKNNVVSKSLNDVISAFKVFGFEKEQEKLKPFYDSIKLRASGIDNAAGKQKLIVTLYDKFFSTGFKDTTEQLGIVFTPVEVVDFIIHSVDDALQKYFGKKLIDNYNIEREKLNKNKNYQLNRDTKYIKWTKRLEDQAVRNTPILYNVNNMRLTLYRPFVKKWMYYQPETTERVRLFYKKWGESNKAIVTTGRGINKNFSTLITDTIPDFQSFMNSQGFMRYDNEKHSAELLNTGNNNLNHTVANKIGLSEDDTFAYTYGLLNSQDYQKKYQNDLTKELARIPIVKDKERYVEIGKKLIDMHINYEKMPVYDKVKIDYNGKPNYRVSKMKFAKRRNVNGKVENDRSTIIYNDSITISEIPDKAYQYIVNGRSAIEWIMDQYRVKTDKKSGITDDPNDFSDDPKYIFNLLLRIITVSLKTIDLINQLPKFEVENED